LRLLIFIILYNYVDNLIWSSLGCMFFSFCWILCSIEDLHADIRRKTTPGDENVNYWQKPWKSPRGGGWI